MLSVGSKQLLQKAVSASVSAVTKETKGDDVGRGAYFRCLWFRNPNDGHAGLIPLHEAWVGGRYNKGREGKYSCLAMEKALRAANNYPRDAGPVSSYQIDRDPQKHQYGGSIRIRCVVPELDKVSAWIFFSLSGLATEHGDEAAMALTARKMSWDADEDDIDFALESSGNKLAFKLLALCPRMPR